MAIDPNSSATSAAPAPGSEGKPHEAGTQNENTAEQPERGAGEDLAAGLDLMLRAAKKALKNIEPTRIEELGKRAMRGVESLDRKKVSEFAEKAAKNLDPRKIEEVAEDAGRELRSVIERVAERVEDMIGVRGTAPKSSPPPTEHATEEAAGVGVDHKSN